MFSNKTCKLLRAITVALILIETSAYFFVALAGELKALPIYPGAQGFGIFTIAGRRGDVIRVTNLNDGGPGSLREAVSFPGPRIVIFEVGGTIPLTKEIKIATPYISIAGQSAPSPGITLIGAGIQITTHDVLVQHLRIRVGDNPSGPPPAERDALQISGKQAYNIVIDHISASWAIDENGSTWMAGPDITVANCIFSEGLNQSIHPKGPHSKGFIIGNNTKNVALIGNLFAHNMERQPRINGGSTAVVANNVMYNVGSSAHIDIGQSQYTSLPLPENSTLVSIVGNVFIPGSNTKRPHRAVHVLRGRANDESKVYLKDNVINGISLSFDTIHSPQVTAPPAWPPLFQARPAKMVEDWIIAQAGARPSNRDKVDQRIIQDLRKRGGRIINSPSDVGGEWPQQTSTRHKILLPAESNGDDDKDGYTNIEEILHEMANTLNLVR